MNRNTTTWLTLGSAAALFALGTACSSGGTSDGNGTAGKTSTTTGGTLGTGGTTGTGTSGSSTGTSGSTTGGSTTGGSTTGGSTTGGSTTGGSTSGPSVCDGMTTILPVTLAYIDNFDDGLRADGWYSFSDTATPDMPPKPAYETGGPSIFPTGKFAHIIATGIKSPTMMGYGAGFGFNLVDPSKEKCIDLSAFEGISFWAKGTAGATNSLQFQAVVPETAPTKDGGDCPMIMNAAGMMVPGPDCYLHPSKMITLTADWKQITIKFADLTAKKAKWKNLILGFNMITPGPAYDVEVDEFSFYVTGMIPAGHVTPPVEGGGGTGGGGSGGGGGTGGT